MKIIAIAAMTSVVGMTAPAERAVTVYAVDNGLNTRGVLYQAQQRAAKMFAEVGVRLDWRTGRPSGTRAQRVPVIVISLAEHTPAGYSPEALASAKVYEGVHITVFWDRIAPLSLFAPPTVVLAHVLVHEITHILQGVDRHSETGVMKAQWTPEDFHAMLSKPLPFTTLDVQLIRLGLARLVDPTHPSVNIFTRMYRGAAQHDLRAPTRWVPLSRRASIAAARYKNAWINRG